MLGWLLTLLGCEKQARTESELPALDREADMKLFYPVLRDYEAADPFGEIIVHRPIADGLAVFACRRVPRPGGRVGIDYVMKANLEVYGLSEDEILAACYDNFFAANIQVDVAEQDDARLYQLTSSHRLVAAILGHDSTYAKFVEMTGSANMAVLIASPDMIYVTPMGSSFDSRFAEIAEKTADEAGAIDLTPSVYHWTEAGGLVAASARQTEDADGQP